MPADLLSLLLLLQQVVSAVATGKHQENVRPLQVPNRLIWNLNAQLRMKKEC